MAYPVVCDSCLDDDHDLCIEHSEETYARRERAREEWRTGGAFCICNECPEKTPVSDVWYQQVLAASIASRKTSK